MRILHLIHDYLPLHAAGSEIYTANLAAAQRAAGHDVAVFTCEEDRAAPQWSLREREHEGVPVFEAIYNRVYEDLAEQWDDARMAEVLAGVLERWKPDLVHVQGLQFVGGVSALKAVAAHGVPAIMTLHEYWLLCPRAGLMYDPTGRACETATPADCARCVDIYPIDRQRWSDARHGGQPANGAGDAPDAADKPASGRFAELGNRRWFARALAQREVDLEAVRHLVGRFVAPSRFLLERFVAAGWPREKLVHADYGFPPPAAVRRKSRGTGPLRVAYTGTLSDYKGAEVLGRAVAQLAARARHDAPPTVRATIHGHLDWFPEVAARLKALAAESRGWLRLAGPFQPSARDEVLADLDLLVVPSLWWENSPLTIHEAWQRGVPVLASDRGGMAELVGAGGGALFPPGDDLALSVLLGRAAGNPSLVGTWRASIPPVRLIGDDVRLVEDLARQLGVPIP